MDRRAFVKIGVAGLASYYLTTTTSSCARNGKAMPKSKANLVNLLSDEPDKNGLHLPPGFTSRVIARSGRPVISGSDYLWHDAPDGGASFATESGGWIYVSNSEVRNSGGVGAIEFSRSGQIVRAYPILSGTSRNCGGGVTPWGTWLSGEEVDDGKVWECDPFGKKPAKSFPALGLFNHESVAIDDVKKVIYLTEDHGEGGLYRYTPATIDRTGRYDLTKGQLEICQIKNGESGAVQWLSIADSTGSNLATRLQQSNSTKFNGGEGVWYQNGLVYFVTKGDNRIWRLDTGTDTIGVFYDDDMFENPELTGLDALIMTPDGRVWVAEDGGNMQVIALKQDLSSPESMQVMLQISGHENSEVTGIAFDPNFQRLYLSSQRGTTGKHSGGITYEISGNFLA